MYEFDIFIGFSAKLKMQMGVGIDYAKAMEVQEMNDVELPQTLM